MKILLTGTIHVGKTTLLERLKTTPNRQVTYIPELARELMNNKPNLVTIPGKDGILPGLADYSFAEQTRREQAATEESTHVVCDRGIVDLITHTRLFGKHEKPEWIDWTRTYDQIYLLEPTDIPLNTEGYPVGRDWFKFRDQLDEQTRGFLDEQQLKYFCLSGPLEEKEWTLRRAIEGQLGRERERC